MHRIHVNFYIHASPERVFDVFADHEHFFRGGPVKSARVIRDGRNNLNGLGAIREIRAGGMRFLEEIVSFERPWLLGYRIIECTIPVNHNGGWIHFISRGAGTEIDWVSDFEIPILLAGKLLERFFERVFVSEFTRMALQAKQDIESCLCQAEMPGHDSTHNGPRKSG